MFCNRNQKLLSLMVFMAVGFLFFLGKVDSASAGTCPYYLVTSYPTCGVIRSNGGNIYCGEGNNKCNYTFVADFCDTYSIAMTYDLPVGCSFNGWGSNISPEEVNTSDHPFATDSEPGPGGFLWFKISGNGTMSLNPSFTSTANQPPAYILPPPAPIYNSFSLSVTKPVGGTIISNNGTINCGDYGSSCFWYVSDTASSYSVYVKATASTNNIFNGWNNVCSSYSGDWCVIDLSSGQSKTISLAFTPEYTLNIHKVGNGVGSISDGAGIDCGDTCSSLFLKGSAVDLISTPETESNSVFRGWFTSTSATDTFAGCTSIGGCTIIMNSNQNITVKFVTYALNVRKDPLSIGNGKITSSDGLIDCGSKCSNIYSLNSYISLTATSDANSYAGKWIGCDSINENTCSLMMDDNPPKNVSLVFEKVKYSLGMTKSGSGKGAISSSPALVNCDSGLTVCGTQVYSGSFITLVATANAGSIFKGWSGACSGSSNCGITMDKTKNLIAVFESTNIAQNLLVINKNGSGIVTASPSGINCGSICSAYYNTGSNITLEAVSTPNSTFLGWGGSCSGTAACTIKMDVNKNVQANFSSSGLSSDNYFNQSSSSAATVGLGSIDGGVRDTNTNLALSNVNLRLEQGNSLIKSAITGSDGVYLMDNIPNGQYNLIAAKSGYDNWSKTVAITANLDLVQNIALTLTAGATFGNVSGKVTDTNGNPVSGSIVNLVDPNGNVKYVATTDANGDYSITGVIPGDYTLSLTKPGFSNQSQTVTIGAQDKITDNTVLTPGTNNSTGSLGGQAVGANGQPLAGAQVSVIDQNGNVKYTATTDQNGNYSIIGVTPGSYLILATDKNGNDQTKTDAIINAKQNTKKDLNIANGKNEFTLTVLKTGMGRGAVVSNKEHPEISCGENCAAGYKTKITITLTAAAGSKSVFANWSGACEGSKSPVCTFELGANKNVTAKFNALPNKSAAYQGVTDKVDCYNIAGWVYDKKDTKNNTYTSLYDGNKKITENVAALFRPDLSKAKIGSGNYGFNLLTPTELKDGKKHNLNLRYADTNTKILGKGKKVDFVLTCPASSNKPDLIVQLVTAPNSTAPEQNILVETKIKNNGGKLIKGSYVTARVILSSDFNINPKSKYYSDFKILNSELGVGKTIMKIFNYKLPLGLAGKYYVGAYLDPNNYHDEYTKSNNSFYDSTPLLISSTANRLTIAKAGAGEGSVSSDFDHLGISCGKNCSVAFPVSEKIELTAVANAGSSFVGWSDPACFDKETCAITMDATKNITATFNKIIYSLTVSQTGLGSGNITSNGSWFACSASGCQGNTYFGNAINITATAQIGSIFSGWDGACSGSGQTCQIVMDDIKNAVAKFDKISVVPTVPMLNF
jgi:protocatechuate 3,4-dioxygenase beta subunit